MKILTYIFGAPQGQQSLIILASLGFIIDPLQSVLFFKTLKMATWNRKRSGKDRKRLFVIFKNKKYLLM
jgi:hypothetical protein